MHRSFRLPLIPCLIAYGSGIFLGQFDPPFPQGYRLFFLTGLVALWIFLLVIKRRSFGTVAGLAFLLILGEFSIATYLRPPRFASSIVHFAGAERISLEGTVKRPPEHARDGVNLLVNAERVFLRSGVVPVSGTVLLFVKGRQGPFRLGDRVAFVCRLEKPVGFRNEGGFSYERYLAFQRIDLIGFLQHTLWIKTGERVYNKVLIEIENWRDQIRELLERESSYPSSSILKALVLGEREDIPDAIIEDFVSAGIAHLLAISGDHLGIVAFLSFFLILWLLKRSEFLLLTVPVRKVAALLTIPCILLYTLIAGAGISVIRATTMVIIFFLSIVLDRERNMLHSLGVAAFVILFFSPPSLFDVSFQLSFLAVLSILLLVPRFLEMLKRKERLSLGGHSRLSTLASYAKISFTVTLVATVGTAPFVALHFNRVSPIGLVTNLIFIPWVGFILVPGALGASLISFLHYGFASFLVRGLDALTQSLLRAVALFASMPFSSLYVPTPTFLEIAIFYFLLVLAIHLRKGRTFKYAFVACSILFLFDLGYWNLKDRFFGKLRLTFVDVGHGDCVLVEFPGGRRMLVDGGGLPGSSFDIGRSVVAPFLWKKKIRRIDHLVLTHPDPDHMGGLKFIASSFSIGEFWESGFGSDSGEYLRLVETLERKKIPRRKVDCRIGTQDLNGVSITVLNPCPGDEIRAIRGEAAERSLRNNRSLVLRLDFKNVSILLPGDIEAAAEQSLVLSNRTLRADVMKVPHHGSLSSSSLPFLRRVKPLYAILSVGRNCPGNLPNKEVVQRYRSIGAKILRTDRDGAITVETDGDRIAVKTFLGT